MHTNTTRCQSWTIIKQFFSVLWYPFFFFVPDILKMFNPNIKGMSKGRGQRQTGFNVAVSGAKISWVLKFLIRVIRIKWFVFKYFVNSWICLILYRGIPGQVRHLIDKIKNDTVSLRNWMSTDSTAVQLQQHKFCRNTLLVINKKMFSVPSLCLCLPGSFCIHFMDIVSGFPEWLEAGDPLHWRQWPVSVLQRPGELL